MISLRAPDGFFDSACKINVVILDQYHIIQADAMILPAPRRTASLSTVRRPGAVLRVSKITARVPVTASTN